MANSEESVINRDRGWFGQENASECTLDFSWRTLMRLFIVAIVASVVLGFLLVCHGVQHLFHPPVLLPRWPSEDRRTRIVFITRDLPRQAVEESFMAFAEADPPFAPARLPNDS